MPAGYSSTPLSKKLGIKQGHTVALHDEPDEFSELLTHLPDEVAFVEGIPERADIVIIFATERKVFEAAVPSAADAVFPDGAVWIAWPKKSSKVATDMTEDVVREVALPINLVDNKVCAISDVWSGLRIVWRKEHRR
ncbi:MAG: DUF3052 domain-containing protein [Acidobacteria bacterium]|nr:DUF3052 domain-containing protein [Acidobacteriota bacterium]